MDALSYKTISANKATVNKDWIVVDAENMILGRFSSEIAKRIRGKHKTNYTPHVDCGDNVIVINAEKVRLTGKKFAEKEYIHYTGYPGGQRFASPKMLMDKNPALVIEKAVRGMIPRTKLGDAIIKNLHVYGGSEHPHAAQQPKAVKL